MTGEPATEAPVNGGLNYNGPKVAKFLVGPPKKVMEVCKGFLGLDGDWPSSAKEERSLTARPTRRAGTKPEELCLLYVSSASVMHHDEVRPIVRCHVDHVIIVFYTTYVACAQRKSLGNPTQIVPKLAAFGRIYKDQDLLIEIVKELSVVAGGFDMADLFPSYKFLHVFTSMGSKLKTLHRNLDTTLNKILDEHKKNSEHKERCKTGMDDEDFLDTLFRLKNSGDLEFPFTTDHIKAAIVDAFAAGTDTSLLE
ncbi:hypothetical protein L1887_24671 [Cichorium endivia]|nr:hypothetical protein L1887_24671 [Cichorium endivia]